MPVGGGVPVVAVGRRRTVAVLGIRIVALEVPVALLDVVVPPMRVRVFSLGVRMISLGSGGIALGIRVTTLRILATPALPSWRFVAVFPAEVRIPTRWINDALQWLTR